MHNKQVLVVLGMHRSGTSALTEALSRLGWPLPDALMPAADDNKRGYFESKIVAGINNQLLAALGQSWTDSRALNDADMLGENLHELREQARAFLRLAFADQSRLLLKDPRMCRTLPFWRAIFTELNIEPKVVLVVRSPDEVARSLRIRLLNDATQPAAIASLARSHRLWLRYVLDAERYSRDLPRVWFSYQQLLAEGDSLLAALPARLHYHAAVGAGSGDKLFDNSLQRQQLAPITGGNRQWLHYLYDQACEVAHLGEQCLNVALWEQAAAALQADDHKQQASSITQPAPWANSQLTRWQARLSASVPRHAKSVLFVSDDAHSVGNIYRMKNHAAALRSVGVRAQRCALANWQHAELSQVQLIIVFRPRWQPALAELVACARRLNIKVLADFDDLLFAPNVMQSSDFDYYQRLSVNEQQDWQQRISEWQQALAELDGAVVSTAPLAEAARAAGKPAWLWRNGLSRRSWRLASELYATFHAKFNQLPLDHLPLHAQPLNKDPLLSRVGDGLVRIGYASGTPTHQQDFKQASAAMAKVLARFPFVRLTVVGHLSLAEFSELAPFAAQIERRGAVPYADLLYEYARFDINVAPLAWQSRFCAAKSELKFFEPASLGIVSVASPTPPFVAAIRHGIDGYLAEDEHQWVAHLCALITEPTRRVAMGAQALQQAWVRFGPEQQAEEGLQLLTAVTDFNDESGY